MAGLFGISIDPNDVGRKKFFQDSLYWGVSYGSHLGEDNSGISILDERGNIETDSREGLFIDNFKERIKHFFGTEAIGYCGPALEPFHMPKSKLGTVSLCFTGNIRNCDDLVEMFLSQNRGFRRADNIEVICKLILQGADIVDGIKKMAETVEGSYCLLILSKDGLWIFRSPDGRWSLSFGKSRSKRCLIVSSEQGGFDNLGFDFHSEVEPGKIYLLSQGDIKKECSISGEVEVKRCAFYQVYTSNPSHVVDDIPASFVRERLGGCLAATDMKKEFLPHIVMPVPASGNFHADGYKSAFDAALIRRKIDWTPIWFRCLIKYIFTRSYLAPTQQERMEKAYYKIITTGGIKYFLEWLEQQRLERILDDIKKNGVIKIVLCEDSVVRGTQVKSNLIPKIRRIFSGYDNIKPEIHIRASFPPLLSYCPYGKTTKRGELLVEKHPEMKNRVEFLRVDSLKYNDVANLVQVLGVSEKHLCLDCIS